METVTIGKWYRTRSGGCARIVSSVYVLLESLKRDHGKEVKWDSKQYWLGLYVTPHGEVSAMEWDARGYVYYPDRTHGGHCGCDLMGMLDDAPPVDMTKDLECEIGGKKCRVRVSIEEL